MGHRPPHLILAGGGLANCLIALRVASLHDNTRISIIEAGPELGGNHTWSFHAGDLDTSQHAFIKPLIGHRWPAQDVQFPSYGRRLDSAYFSITSEALRNHMATADFEIHTGSRVNTLDSDFVETEAGGRLQGLAVIDGRGQASASGIVLGFQKFFGRELELAGPHGIDCPLIMDATVSQADGYRFIYLLPFSTTTLLIEDTRYSDGAELADSQLSQAIDEYASAKGWRIIKTRREERGVLPILLAGDFEQFWPAEDPVARSGLRAGLFHPTTGYSLPQAVSLADAVARHWPMNGQDLALLTRRYAQAFWHKTRFFRMLNRMLFRAGPADQRYRVMERFYALSEPLIVNFYAARLRLRDQARLVLGKSPVPFLEAASLVRERPFMRAERQTTRK